jgi:hypothetical protein
VRDAERLARQAVEEVARDRLARGEADACTKPSNCAQASPSCGEGALDLGVFGDVQLEGQRRAESAAKFGDPVLEPLALVAERELGALAVAGTRDAIAMERLFSTP